MSSLPAHETAEVFGPDRPMARRAAAGRVECAQAALDALIWPDAQHGTALRELRRAELAYAPYWAG